MEQPITNSTGATKPRGGRLRIIPIAFVLCALLAWVSLPAGTAEGWEIDYNKALAAARASNKKLLVQFTLPHCPPCIFMDRAVLGTKAVRSALDGFIPVRIDAATQPEIAHRFEVIGTPTFAIVDPNGTVLEQREGYQSVEEFVAFLGGTSASPTSAQESGSQPGQASP